MPLGKIARLPHAIREQLNQRLQNHELGQPLLDWLNGLPEVREIVAGLFDGKPISKQNLSQWRNGGFRRWQTSQEALKQVPQALSEAVEWQEATGKPLSDIVSVWGAVHYLLTAKTMMETSDRERDRSTRLKFLHRFVGDAVALQRGEFRSGRLKLDHERLAFFQERVAAKSAGQADGKLPSHPSPAAPACRAEAERRRERSEGGSKTLEVSQS